MNFLSQTMKSVLPSGAIATPGLLHSFATLTPGPSRGKELVPLISKVSSSAYVMRKDVPFGFSTRYSLQERPLREEFERSYRG